ncbi:MAG TPA: type II toxin-antitoxin system death-on-curing family toxin [Aquabacterium sp.]|nr:type II toxin-antitoxin system death-on-curing family toxin [Aquabacterium sp.]
MTTPRPWRWVDRKLLVLLHDESLAMHGGACGIRDEGLLESALARAANLTSCGEPDFADLAACYAFGLANNRPFIDGNKRAAFLSVGLFLGLNGYRLTSSQAEAAVAVFGLAASDIDEPTFVAWLRERVALR